MGSALYPKCSYASATEAKPGIKSSRRRLAEFPNCVAKTKSFLTLSACDEPVQVSQLATESSAHLETPLALGSTDEFRLTSREIFGVDKSKSSKSIPSSERALTESRQNKLAEGLPNLPSQHELQVSTKSNIVPSI